MSESPGGLIDLAPGVSVRDESLQFQYSRSSGPGGQNVNKVNTRVQMWVELGAINGLSERAIQRLKALAGSRLTAAGELHLVAETERTQEGNRSAVLERLRLLIEQAVKEPKKRRKTRPSKGSRERRLGEKKRRGEIKARRQGRE